jgi:hypothetical protein
MINEKRCLNIVEVLLTIIFVGTSLGLLITGRYCYYGPNYLPNNNARCEDIFISGIIMSFISGCVLIIWFFIFLVNRCDNYVPTPVVKKKNPIRRRPSIVSSEV